MVVIYFCYFLESNGLDNNCYPNRRNMRTTSRRYIKKMISPRKTSQILAIVLILLMGAALAVPPGLHLELCFGEGSHFEISLDSCHDAPLSQQLVQCDSVLKETHPGECLDLAVACDSFQEFLSPDRKVGLHKTKINKDPPPATAIFAGAFSTPQPASGNYSPFRLARQAFPPSHLVSLRTVVLLI